MDRKEFAVSLLMLSDSLPPRKELSDAAIEGYWLALKDLADGQIRGCIVRALRESKFLPAPSELRELAGSGKAAAALVAWDAVRAAMRKHGYTTSVDFGPVVNAVVRNMGGWIRLDDMPTAELDVWGKKEFERVYGLLSTQSAESLNGAPLVGQFGGEPVRIAIGGIMPLRRLGAVSETSAVVRQLADAKSGAA
jgi:hypothetical protein